MFKHAIIALLFVATIQNSYYISPLYPPTAFEGQFYEVRFRIRGLDYPNFSFSGLPTSLHGSADGVVSGIARGPGSFSVKVNFHSGSESGSAQVVLRITPGTSSYSTLLTTNPSSVSQKLVIGYPENLVYTVGSSIELSLQAQHGASPLLWRYINLPNGLYGNQNGVIKGSFSQSGYYSFNVECSDSVGVSTEAYITLNIQPQANVRTTQVVQVQSQHVPLQYDIEQVEEEQVAADNELFGALEVVNKKKAVVQGEKKAVAVATLAVNNAQASLNVANDAYNKAVSDRNFAQERLRIAASALKAAQENLNLAIIEQGNAQKAVSSAQKLVSDAQKRFVQAQKDVQAAEDRIVKAQADLKGCEQNLRNAQAARQAAQNEFDRAFEDLEDARFDLESAKRRKELADIAVSNARDTLDIIQQARDDALAAVNIAEFALKEAEQRLAKVLDRLAYIRSLYTNAKIALGEAQWAYEQAINKLYVAQSRKESADRATAIALGEGSYSDHNSASSSSKVVGGSGASFIGCSANNYPSIQGTVQITEKHATGYRVSTGHEMLYGLCTQKTDCQVGDLVEYNGFIVNGVINAQRIERVLLS